MPAAGLGDLVMAAPVIRALRVRFADGYLAVLAHRSRGAAELAACMPYIDEVIDFRLRRYSWPEVLRFFCGPYWQLLWRLRRLDFETAVILAPNPIRTILVKMLRPSRCLTVPGRDHPTAEGLALVKQLGCSDEPLDFGFEVPDVPTETLLPADLPRPWIGVHPFGSTPWRRWSGYRQVIDTLRAKGGTIILLGKQPDHHSQPDTLDLVNRLNVLQLTAVIARLDVLITCDSGPMHIAFATATPTVAIFGAFPPRFLMPLRSAPIHRVIYHPRLGQQQLRHMKERRPMKVNYFDFVDASEVCSAATEILDR